LGYSGVGKRKLLGLTLVLGLSRREEVVEECAETLEWLVGSSNEG
jgi:hypothetical protein